MTLKRYGTGEIGPGHQALPFARAVQADGWLHVSGQVPMVDGEIVSGGIVPQTQQAIRNLLAVLQEAGYGTEHVEAALPGACLGYERRYTGPLRQVGRQRQKTRAGRLHGAAGGAHVAAGHADHVGARAGQRDRDRLPHAAARAGHEGDLAVQAEHRIRFVHG